MKKKLFRLEGFEARQKTEIILVGLVMFGLLFSYPVIRSTTDALFLEHFKARNSPQVWLLSSVVLVGAIALLSRLQKFIQIQKLFLALSIFTALCFLGGTWFHAQGQHHVLYALYALKETYIVMLVHITLAHLNTLVTVEQAKLLYGPLGAVGSLGGILGGSLVGVLVGAWGANGALAYTPLLLVVIGLLFHMTKTSPSELGENKKDEKEELSPLASVKDVWSYVMWLGLLIACTQFAINMAQFLFNLHFEELFTSADTKAAALGKVYLAINSLALILQIFITPFVLRFFKSGQVHTFIPILYLVVSYLGFGFAPGSFLLVGGAYVVMKGMDYSLFSAVKELLYFPLNARQKYGAKYIVDMIFYRLSKGLISTFLIFFQSIFLVQMLLWLILVLWTLTLIPLFRGRSRLLSRS